MTNLLPYDGVALYYSHFLPVTEEDNYYGTLLQTIAWKHEEAVIYGRHITTKRMVAWYGSQPFVYKYSGVAKEALPWTDELLQIKKQVEETTGATYNSCLLNLYHDGGEGMGWHSDNESTLQPAAPIASVSFGAERKFACRHRQTGETLSFLLESGSLFLMKGAMQAHWVHALPKSKKVLTGRINLTFRSMKE